MTKRMDYNVLLVAFVSNDASFKAHRGNAQTFAQSAAVFPAFLLKQIPIGATPS